MKNRLEELIKNPVCTIKNPKNGKIWDIFPSANKQFYFVRERDYKGHIPWEASTAYTKFLYDLYKDGIKKGNLIMTKGKLPAP